MLNLLYRILKPRVKRTELIFKLSGFVLRSVKPFSYRTSMVNFVISTPRPACRLKEEDFKFEVEILEPLATILLATIKEVDGPAKALTLKSPVSFSNLTPNSALTLTFPVFTCDSTLGPPAKIGKERLATLLE